MWKFKGKGRLKYQGTYEFDRYGEREFVLVAVNATRKKDLRKPYPSHEAAKQAGWVKVS